MSDGSSLLPAGFIHYELSLVIQCQQQNSIVQIAGGDIGVAITLQKRSMPVSCATLDVQAEKEGAKDL